MPTHRKLPMQLALFERHHSLPALNGLVPCQDHTFCWFACIELRASCAHRSHV